MDRSEILDKLFEYKSRYQNEYHFTRIGIFGSAARGTAENHSDIDIVIEQEKPDLFILGSIKTDLEKELGKKVDIIRLRKEMNSFLRHRIDQEAVYV